MYAEGYVIYADLLFIINFSLDFLCLFITGRLANCGGSTWRMVLGAFAGGIYSFLPYLLYITPIIAVPIHIAAAAIICLIAFRYQEIKKFIAITLTFVISSALLGGLVTAIYGISGQYSNGAYGEITAMSFAVICGVSAIITLLYGLVCRRKINTRHAEVRIYIKGNKFHGQFLADSGNLVTEPFSALPVIIISSSALPKPFDDPESSIFPVPTRAIPFSTASGGGCFFGFRPDRIELIVLGKKPRIIDAYIAIDTAGNTYSGYDGIIPTSLL